MEFTYEIKKELHERLKDCQWIKDFNLPHQIFEEIYHCAKVYFDNLIKGQNYKQMGEGFVNGYCLCLENRAYITAPEKIHILAAIFEVCENLFNDKKEEKSRGRRHDGKK